MIAREQRRRLAEEKAIEGLRKLTARRTSEPVWASARDIASESGGTVRSTSRALLRMVSHGRVAAILQVFRDSAYRPRERRLYQLHEGIQVAEWPAWARLNPPGARPPDTQEVEDEHNV